MTVQDTTVSEVATGVVLSDPAAATPVERVAAFYGSAMASTQLREWARADAALQKGLAVARASPHADNHAEREFLSLQALSLIARGDCRTFVSRVTAAAGEPLASGGRSAVIRAERRSIAALRKSSERQ